MARHFWGEVTTRLRAWARKDSSFTRYFPSKAGSRNLRYVLSQNIPEPGAYPGLNVFGRYTLWEAVFNLLNW